ncbi:SirB2 family protein [Pseudoxanthomonas sacheonensis]|uniref:Membrane protein SirB2 n=1 Tax=Pseudoxanthomonas sacheonensis TaxID=443615 RepID=A0ABU1RQ36_9GAMM|nr:SirB2 family protein [Pseudoxanthomonas sacheonensis]MDR6840035.1 putative membrane protein SirB2 [Pseudoxanthomonas sacheonensis]
MIEFYAQIKWVHIASIIASGLLFLFRGSLVLAGRERIAMLAPLRFLSYSIDTVLLSAALMLLTILPHAMYANGWLTLKLVLVVVYVVLGSLALKRGRTAGVRAGSFVAGLAVYLTIVGIARIHHPWGWLHYWMG